MNRSPRGMLYAIAAIAVAASPVFANPASIDIEPQPLSSALQDFAKQTGVQIIFFSKSVEGHDARALNGRYEPEDAIALLLEGTGLDYHVLNERAIEVVAAAPGNDKAPPSGQRNSAMKMDEVEITAERQQLPSLRANQVSLRVVRGSTARPSQPADAGREGI